MKYEFTVRTRKTSNNQTLFKPTPTSTFFLVVREDRHPGRPDPGRHLRPTALHRPRRGQRQDGRGHRRELLRLDELRPVLRGRAAAGRGALPEELHGGGAGEAGAGDVALSGGVRLLRWDVLHGELCWLTKLCFYRYVEICTLLFKIYNEMFLFVTY